MNIRFNSCLRLSLAAGLLMGTLAGAQTVSPQNVSFQTREPLDKVLDRASQRVTAFLDVFSDVKCTEQVTQEKLRADGKVELGEQSTYDYLVILNNTGGDVSLNESRLPIKEAKADQKKKLSMLVSNGFATLFLIFHPYYFNSFEFTDAGTEVIDGHTARKVRFEHLHNTHTPAALALRGREYPLELSGTAWIDPATGDLLRLDAGIAKTLEDIGMKTLQSSTRFEPVVFAKDQPVYWFPAEAVVEVESAKQHWRNTHRFSTYKQFSVSTEEHVAQK
jgi:hypothetical protein